MQLTAYNHNVFSNIGAGLKLNVGNDGPPVYALDLPRTNAAPLVPGTTRAARTISATVTVLQGYDVQTVFTTVLGWLEAGREEACVLSGTLNDGTAVETLARFGQYRYIDSTVNQMIVDFIIASDVWHALTATTVGPVTMIKGANGFAVPNTGKARAWPTIGIQQTYAATRTPARNIGWSLRKQVDVTNNTARDWHNQIVFVDIGDTAALVTGSYARSDGKDFRVFYQGRQFAREFIGWNTTVTVMAVRLSIPAGTTITLDLVYGNSAQDTDTGYRLSSASSSTAMGMMPSSPWTPINLENEVGTASGGTTSTMTGVTGSNNKWRGGYVIIYGGTGATQYRKITTFTGGTLTVSRNFTTAPDATSKYIVFQSGYHIDGGRASAGGAATLTDSSQVWDTNEWVGATLYLQSGTGSGQTATVLSNTGTVLTVTANWATPPDNTTGYRLFRLGAYTYAVDDTFDLVTMSQNSFGGWWLANTRTTPSQVQYGDKIPGAWTPVTYFDNKDDYSQGRYRGGTTDSFGNLRARRGKSGSKTYLGEGAADGVAIYSPLGLQGISFDYQWKNTDTAATTAGFGKFVLGGQAAGGEDWAEIVTDSSYHAALTAIAAQYKHLIDYSTPIRLYMGVVPKDDVSMDSASTSDESEARWYQTLRLFYDVTAATLGSLTSQEGIYQIEGTLTIDSGQAGEVTPHTKIEIGGDGHWIFIPNVPGYGQLWVDLDPDNVSDPVVSVIDANDHSVELTPWAAVVKRVVAGIDGTNVEGATGIGGSIQPSRQRLTNPSADTDAFNWTGTAITGTGTLTRDGGATYYGSTSGSFKITITANAVVDGSAIYSAISDPITVVPGQVLHVGGAVRTSTSSLRPRLYLGGVTDTWNATLSSGLWYPRANSYIVPAGTTTITVAVYVLSYAAVTGTIYFDDLYLGASTIYYEDAREADMGSTEITVTFNRGWIV